jgi:proline iminopeptidase
LHGGPGSGAWWLEKLSGPMLEKHFQMIYVDQRGVARSTSPKDGNYSMDRMARDFEEVRDALKIPRWVTLGHSLGGLLQMGYALRYPNSVQAMIMLNCSLNFELSAAETAPKLCELLNGSAPCPDPAMPAAKRWLALARKLREKDLFWKVHYAHRENERIMSSTFKDVPDWNQDFENIAMSLPDYQADFTAETAEMKMPVLFFYGKTDWAAGPEHHRHVRFPNLLKWGSDTGHVPFLENPTDLEKAIAAFRAQYGF